jgi:hypothetical protein
VNDRPARHADHPTRELLDGRMASGRELAAATGRVREARAALDEVERAYALAYSDALAAGWTRTELQAVFESVGIEVPSRGRHRRSPEISAVGRATEVR